MFIAMLRRVAVDEVAEFRSAVAGVEIDWVRVDRGWGPAFMVACGDDRVAVSSGGHDFSAVMRTQIPTDHLGLQLVTRAPDGMRWCGMPVRDMDLFLHGAGASLLARSPAGTRAVSIVAALDPLQAVAAELGLPELRIPPRAAALPRTPEVVALALDVLQVSATPRLLDAEPGTTRLLEAIARAIAGLDARAGAPRRRGFDSRGIVAACLEYAETSGDHQPPISRLCWVAHASESRLRQAFVDVVGLPPGQFFQLRVLSMLRDQLMDPARDDHSVASAAASLGLTQLGRVAGRYRTAFGETPRDTLRRTRLHRT